jgi:FMN phosphatase YigB (HAD superfamily)
MSAHGHGFALANPYLRIASFDVFDTLIARDTSPAAVASEAAALLAEALRPLGALRVDSDLILAHRRAWTAVREAGYPNVEVEWSIDAWLDDLAQALDLDRATVVGAGREAELDAEIRATSRRPIAQLMLADARRAGMTVVALSDTTLDAWLLGRLLDAHRIVVDHVFASCDLRASKRRGTAYPALANALGCEPREIAHVGDNLKADVARAANAGIAATWLPRTSRQSEAVRLVDALFACEPFGGDDPVERAAYDHVAPLLVAMGIARARYSQTVGAGRTLYLARDAWLMEHVDRRCGLTNDTDAYLRLSRKAVVLAHPDNLLRSIGLSGKVGKTSLRAFIGGFDLDPTLESSLVAASDVDIDSPIDDVIRKKWAAACTALAAPVEASRAERRARVRELLERHVAGATSVMVVDLGWAGTIQDAIGSSLPELQVHGFYAGLTVGGCAPTVSANKRGLLWDEYRGVRAIPLGKSAGVIRLWELLLREPAPTVVGLRRDEGGRSVALMGDSTLIDEAAIQLAARVRRGIDARLDRIAHRAHAVVEAPGIKTDDALARVARRHFAQLSLAPRPSLARALVDVTMDEGATRGVTTTLGRGGAGHGVSWWPGWVASLLAGKPR